MKPLTVRNDMHTVHSNYSLVSIGYAGNVVHTIEYSICSTKYTVHANSYTRHTFGLYCKHCRLSQGDLRGR